MHSNLYIHFSTEKLGKMEVLNDFCNNLKVKAVDMLDNTINEKPSVQKLHNLAVVRGS